MIAAESLVKKLAERIRVRRIKEAQLRDNLYVKAKGGKERFKYLSDEDVADIYALDDLIKFRYFDNETLLKVLKARRFQFRFLRKANLVIPNLISELREYGANYVIRSYESKMQVLDQEKNKKHI